jgi:nucleoside-diphosphate-sugar epimerase
MNYLIFGGSGFIGSHLVDFIRETDKISIIYNLDIVENNHNGKSMNGSLLTTVASFEEAIRDWYRDNNN